jgi:AraC-like DNA-binding protein
MTAIPLVRASASLPILDLLAEIGAPGESLWERSGLSPQALQQPDALVPLRLASEFHEAAARGQGIDDLGFVAGRRSGLRSLGLFGEAIRQSLTLFEAIKAAQALVAGHNSGARYWLSEGGEKAGLHRRFVGIGESSRQADLFTLALMIEQVGLASGGQWQPTEVQIQSPGAAPAGSDEAFSGARITTGQRATGIVFPRALLACPLPRPANRMRPSIEEIGEWLRTGPPNDLAGSARALVESLLMAGRRDIATAADAAGMSVRTFQRRLGMANVTYSRLVEEVRFAAAVRLLGDPTRKAIDVAYELGFSDPAHFTRAFRRWTSLSPAEYRRLTRSAVAGAPSAFSPLSD